MNTQQSARRQIQHTWYPGNAIIRHWQRLLFFLCFASGSLIALSSCHSQYDEGSMEGHYDTIQQNRTNDQSMSNQQHDGLNSVKPDSSATSDSLVQPK